MKIVPAVKLNIPPELYERLYKAAKAHRLSLGDEIIACIESILNAEEADLQEVLAQARLLRAKKRAREKSDE